MRALNLYILSRYTDTESYMEYYRAMSGSGRMKQYAREEIDTLRVFVDTLFAEGGRAKAL